MAVPLTAEQATELVKTEPILLRAPDGELAWTIIELQGAITESKAGSLEGVAFGKLVRQSSTV